MLAALGPADHPGLVPRRGTDLLASCCPIGVRRPRPSTSTRPSCPRRTGSSCSPLLGLRIIRDWFRVGGRISLLLAVRSEFADHDRPLQHVLPVRVELVPHARRSWACGSSGTGSASGDGSPCFLLSDRSSPTTTVHFNTSFLSA